MPYKLKKVDDGYKVESVSGKLLSKKPLSKKQAEKQRIAVSINEGLFGGEKPPEKDFYIGAREAYHKPALSYFWFDENNHSKGYWGLFEDTYYTKVWNLIEGKGRKESVLIAIKGTEDKSDWIYNLGEIPFDALKDGYRYKQSVKDLQRTFQAFPPEFTEYYLTGHSLGSAIGTQLMRDYPFIKSAVIFNSASQPSDFKIPQYNRVKRVFQSGDPLYNLKVMGYDPKTFQNKEVIPSKKLFDVAPDLEEYNSPEVNEWLEWAFGVSTSLKNHSLKSFSKHYGPYKALTEQEYINSKKEPLRPQLEKPVDDVGFGGGNSNEKLHAIIFKKPKTGNLTLEDVIEHSQQFIKKKGKPFIRETKQSYRVRNIPKTKFDKETFRTKIINPHISLVFGQLK
jgi:pimeloyl-ACP methyl ester carboxylesterase